MLDETLVALAAPVRRKILERLSKGDALVTEVAAPFDISLNSVSKHIRVLERAKLVRRKVKGRAHVLSLNARPLDEASRWLEKHRALWSRRLQLLDDLLEEEDR
ncbi:MAG: ArsR/SmtB family transcription factor [Archangium sp.]